MTRRSSSAWVAPGNARAARRGSWRVSPVEDQRVAVRIGEEGHVADTRVTLADELDALRLQLGARSGDVGDAERDPMAGPTRELDALVLRLPDRECHVSRLELRGLARVLRKTEHVAVERDRTLDVSGWNVDEVDALDLHC